MQNRIVMLFIIICCWMFSGCISSKSNDVLDQNIIKIYDDLDRMQKEIDRLNLLLAPSEADQQWIFKQRIRIFNGTRFSKIINYHDFLELEKTMKKSDIDALLSIKAGIY